MAARAARAPFPAWTAALAIAGVVVVVDQLTKHWAVNALAPSAAHPFGRNIDLVWTLRLNLTFNSGMAFSSGDGLGPLISIAAFVVVVALLVVTRNRDRRGEASTWFVLAVGLVIGGALGNVADRLFRGRGRLRGSVVDFIDLQWWPIFNVADIAVVVGAVLLVLTTLGAERDPA